MTAQSFAVPRVIGRLTRLTSRPVRLRRRWIVPVAVLVGALSGGTYGLLTPTRYAATGYVVVVPSGKGDPAGAMGLAQAYGRAATDIAVVGDAQVWAGVPTRTLKESVRAATSPDAPMISITAQAGRPATAAAIADSVARALVLKGTHTEDSTGVKVLQFTRAARPSEPVSPSLSLSALVGGCAGGLLGGLGLLVRPRREPEGRYAPVPGPAGASGAPAAAPAPQPESV
ncbi:lipopolysaccharide biosynthesis protein [Streptomyces sp. SP18CS02]|uniref:lipopolysaccharide biosynthesis protein n=1 Tax=Streptomyces sp. SP18CS02 TaxID=3002531 RepID=UPI002E792FBE|nr:lipopolysaccharide biosynthesis protein [Streptomyces sp. SP18CS02]MEE1751105.1 lipopolysaccharide biosynthesis protein [Streptomyces sp. SP18CS02]